MINSVCLEEYEICQGCGFCPGCPTVARIEPFVGWIILGQHNQLLPSTQPDTDCCAENVAHYSHCVQRCGLRPAWKRLCKVSGGADGDGQRACESKRGSALQVLGFGVQLRGWHHSLGFPDEDDLGFWFPQKECLPVILTKCPNSLGKGDC